MPFGIDEELMRQLMDVFSIELEEQIQAITDGLLLLEKGLVGEERREVLENVFRGAHNIKGAARGLEANDISEISHHLESIFAVLKRENNNPDGEVTDIALESLDAMRMAMEAFRAQQPVAFDKDDLVRRLHKFVPVLDTQDVSVPEAQATKTSNRMEIDKPAEAAKSSQSAEPRAIADVVSARAALETAQLRLGYATVGELEDFLVAGHCELLLRKTRGPIRDS